MRSVDGPKMDQMITNHRKRTAFQLALFLICALISSAVFFGVYELRYTWYVSADGFIFLRTIFGFSLLVIMLLWTFYPSRILVACVAFACFNLPPLLRGNTFVQIDLGFLPFVALSLLLLVGATELRRRSRGK